MELSKRMQMLTSMVPKGTVLADVGCDHGFVSIDLIQSGICPRVIAMDVRKGPLMRAQEHIVEYGLTDKIETRLSDGLIGLKDGEVEGFLTAGMGGKLIIHIIENSLKQIKKMSYMILQPQSELQEVRKYLRNQGFQIQDEDMVYEEGKYYTALLVNLHSDEQVSYQELVQKAAELEDIDQIDCIYRLGDKYGAPLLVKQNQVLLAYLDWWENRQKVIEKKVDGHESRLREVLAEKEDIKKARKLLI